ncbi:MAG: exonuclease SbcC, partial [Desulfuromonadaceae bacterium]|nr:exonuclease SbcC [Desulfuromonadaceae bacterium]
AGQIETVTGMDFDRFTRSMLLAQGGFAAFLQAAPDERAPILEQITGTEIYSQISIRVHELRSDERKKLDTLQAELAGMQLLSEEDERRLEVSLKQKLLQEVALNNQLEQKNQAIIWLDGIARLEEELSLIATQQRDWQTRQEAFAPEREKLQRATQALELAGDHAGLISLRREQETDRRSHSECLEALPTREETVKRAEEAMELAGEHLGKKKAEQKEASRVIRKARELDLKLREKEAPIKMVDDAITEQEKSLDTLRSKHDENCGILGKKQKTLEDVLKHLSETKVDEGLVEHLAGIRGRFDALKNLHAQQSAKVEEVKAAEKQVTGTNRIWNEQAENLEARKRGLDTIQNALGQKLLELKNTLEDRDLTDWRNRLSALKERKSLLKEVSDAVRSLADSKRTLGELNSRHNALTSVKTNLSEKLQRQIEKHGSLEREMHLLETQLSLLKKIQDFKEARQQLQDDEPCPLCGAKEHPFAEGNIPVPDETTAMLKRVRADLKAANDAVADLQVKQAETIKDLEQIATRKKESAERIANAEALINQGGLELSIETSNLDLREILPRLQKENETNLNGAARVVQAADTMEKEVGTLRESLEKARESVVVAERETQDAAHKKDSAQQILERGRKEAEFLDAQHQKAQCEVQQEVSVYGVETLSTDVLDQVQFELTARRDQWLTRQKEKSELEQKISALELEIRHQAVQINKSDTELNNQREQLSTLRRERNCLAHDRRELFGDKSPDDEESRLSAAIEAAEKDLDGSRQLLIASTQELNKLKNRADELGKSMTVRAGQLKTAEEAFLARLGTSGFTDEVGYLSACLPEDERKKLLQQAQKLTNEQTELESKERDKTARLETERQKRVTNQSREELDQALNALVNNHKEIQQEIGAIRQKLKENDSLRQKQQERAKAIDAQKRECLRWDMLHELIGSADGKKYRNFAQGLTFEMMIGHANRQLQKMTDRYLLIRDDAQPLELNVIDNYQAGETRSTKNLSGGESFIVSLSLALGLSHMASKNVRVDSLFLDEGFGTLDEEALDTALETLAGLQQDGKLIGVISHVPALKERISAQIQVNPQSGGRSVISGPGCSRIL